VVAGKDRRGQKQQDQKNSQKAGAVFGAAVRVISGHEKRSL
jgi:hypothetical protein